MLIPALIDLGDQNPDWRVFVGCGLLVGMVMRPGRVGDAEASGRNSTSGSGFLLVTSVWLFATPGRGAADLLLVGQRHLRRAPASNRCPGLTTTGSTVISGLDALPRGLLMWRSLLQWLGGIGIIGMVLLVLPSLQAGGLALFHMESSDKSDKVLPRVNQLTGGLIAAYIVLTALCAAGYPRSA